jgi:hypothetical protein
MGSGKEGRTVNKAWKGAAIAACMLVSPWSPLGAGAYSKLVDCSIANGFCAQGTDGNGALIPVFAIVHPPGYSGQTVLTVDVCVAQTAPYPDLTQVTQSALATWAALVPTIGNCVPACSLPEDPTYDAGIWDAESVVLHELGHALGLGHPNLEFRDPVLGAFVDTSYSAAHSGSPIGVLVGADNLRGSRDDFMDDVGTTTADNIHWFRESDNDPFVIDSQTIDLNSFSRDTTFQLPSGSSWAANANYCHGFQLGHPRTHSVMYTRITSLMELSGLTADDVNMVKMQRNGENRVLGGGDDYTVTLNFVTSCATAEILVTWDDAIPAGTLAQTTSRVLSTFGTTAHYTVMPGFALPRVFIDLNPDISWNFTGVYADGFETGDTSRWSSVSPLMEPEPLDRPEDDPHPYDCPLSGPLVAPE